MKVGKHKSLMTIILLTAAVFVTFNSMTQTVTAQTNMTAWHTGDTITLDGSDSEADWAIADTLVLTNYGLGSRTDANITLKFLNDGTNLYFYAEWDDSTENSNRKGWSWNSGTTTYDNLAGNEDRFSIAWANSSTNMVCGHSSYTGAPADMLFDVWHWKATRGASGWADDKWWDSNGRNSDAKSSGGYTDNSVVKQAADLTEINDKLGNSTVITIFGVGDLPYWYDNGTVIPWVSGAVTGDTPASIKGYKESKPVGSRGDVSTSGAWTNGRWSLEGMRALVGDPVDDITFEKGKTYDFWIAQMDNSGGTHAADIAMKFNLAITSAARPVTETVTVTTISVDISTAVTTVTETPVAVTSTETTIQTETTTKTEAGYSLIFVTTSLLFMISTMVIVRRR